MGNPLYRTGRAPIGVAVCIVCFLFASPSVPAQTRPIDRQKERAPRQARLVEVFGGTACTDVDPDGACTSSTASAIGEADATVKLKITGNGLEIAPLAAQAFAGERTLDPGVTLDTANNEMSILSGADRRVFMELKFTNWDFDDSGRLLRAFSFALDPSGYVSGLRGRLSPCLVQCRNPGAGAADCLDAYGGRCTVTQEPCVTNDDCPLAGLDTCSSGSRCDYPVASPCPDVFGIPNDFCEPGYFQNQGRPDWAFTPATGILPAPTLGCIIGNPEDTQFIYGQTVVSTEEFRPPPDPFPPDGLYSGTLCLEVPNDAAGTFTVGFDPKEFLTNIVTHLNNIDVAVPTLALVPATITIICQTAADCDDGNPCTRNECRSESCQNPDDFGVDECCNPENGTICERPAEDPGGDFDGDGAVTLADFRILQECFDRDAIDPPCTWVETVCDCTVDLLDVAGFIPLLEGPAP